MKKLTCPLCNGEKVTTMYPVVGGESIIVPCPHCNAKGYVWK